MAAALPNLPLIILWGLYSRYFKRRRDSAR
jgi:hypothetical protein